MHLPISMDTQNLQLKSKIHVRNCYLYKLFLSIISCRKLHYEIDDHRELLYIFMTYIV